MCVCTYLYTYRYIHVQVQSLDLEALPKKEMTTYSSILACKIPQTEGPGQLQSIMLQRVGHGQATKSDTHACMCTLLITYAHIDTHTKEI